MDARPMTRPWAWVNSPRPISLDFFLDLSCYSQAADPGLNQLLGNFISMLI